MIRGNLKLLALKALEKQPLSGYELMKQIGETLGTKPSPGSVYPILDDLSKQNLVVRKESGRKKIYTITKEGKNNLKEVGQIKERMIKHVEEGIRMMSAMTGEKIPRFEETIESLKKGKISVESMPPEIVEMKIELARIFNKGIFGKNKKKVIQTLKKTTEELKKIK